MPKALIILLLLTTLLLSAEKAFSADIVRFRHMASIYSLEEGESLRKPGGLACNRDSLLIVADTGNGRLVLFTYKGNAITGGKEIKVPQLLEPTHVQTNSRGELFALDGKQRRIVILSPKGKFKGYLKAKSLPSTKSYVPMSFRIDKNDNIYILDVFSGRVLKLNREGEYQKQVKFPRGYGFISDLAVDSHENIFIIDSVKAMVYSAGRDSISFSPFSKSLKEFSSFPTSLAVDNRGKIFIVDKHGGGVVLIGPDGTFKERQLGMGWKEGLLRYPKEVCIGGRGDIFIADSGNDRVQIFTQVKSK